MWILVVSFVLAGSDPAAPNVKTFHVPYQSEHECRVMMKRFVLDPEAEPPGWDKSWRVFIAPDCRRAAPRVS